MIRTSKEDREGFIQALRQIKLRVIRVLNNTKPRSVGDGHLVALPHVPIIKVWYGDNQVFGHNGIPQTWVNILGNASARSGIARIVYSLNGGPKQQLWIGKSRTRLVDPGDFNAEIAYSSLLPGANEICLTATARDGHTSQRTVTLNYVADKTCPFSYCIDWSKVSNIQDVVQVIDGHWALRDGGVRTVQIGYDRLFGFGEANTWTNLLGMVEITIHAVDPTGFAVGPIVGWTGHTAEDNGLVWLDQPRTGHPFPADFVYTEHGLIIGSNSSETPESTLVEKNIEIRLGEKHIFKFYVQSNSWGGSHFSFKVWPVARLEPFGWQLQADGVLCCGSVLIAAHRADITVGNIHITPLP